jgi:hypothetical protein
VKGLAAPDFAAYELMPGVRQQASQQASDQASDQASPPAGSDRWSR